MMPASAPKGVKKAPMLLPIILAYIARKKFIPSNPNGKLKKRMLIGMLLIRLAVIVDVTP